MIVFLLVTTFALEIHAASPNTGSLKIFQHAKFGGFSEEFTESKTYFDAKWKKQISSVKAISGNWELYDDSMHLGDFIFVCEGQEIERMNWEWNDKIASAKLVDDCSEFTLEDRSGNPYKGTGLALLRYKHGTVCSDFFGDTENANVICKEMGYNRAREWQKANQRYWTPNQRHYDIKLRVKCTTSRWNQCDHLPLYYGRRQNECFHTDDVLLSCV